MSDYNPPVAFFTMKDAPFAVKDIAYYSRRTKPFDDGPELGKVLLRNLSLIEQQLDPTNPDDASVLALGVVLALPGSERFVLFIGKLLNPKVKNQTLKAYVLPMECALKAQFVQSDFMRIGDTDESHIRGTKNLPSGLYALRNLAKIRYEPEEGFTQKTLAQCELANSEKFVKAVLSKFWVNAFEPCLMTNTDIPVNTEHLIFAPSLMRVACLSVEEHLANGLDLKGEIPVRKLSLIGAELRNYVDFQQGDIAVLNMTIDEFFQNSWANVFEQALQQIPLFSRTGTRLNYIMSWMGIEKNPNPSTFDKVPESVLCLMNIEPAGASLKKLEDPDTKAEFPQAILLQAHDHKLPMSEGKVHPLFSEPNCHYLTAMYGSLDSKEIVSQAKLVQQMTGFEGSYNIQKSLTHRPEDLAQFYFFDLSLAVKSLVEFHRKVIAEENSKALPF